MQAAIDGLWRFVGEMFESDAIDEEAAGMLGVMPSSTLHDAWSATVDAVFEEAGLSRPADPFQTSGGRTGMHTEYLGRLLAEMQWMQRSHPGLTW